MSYDINFIVHSNRQVGYDATRYYWSFRRLNQRCRYRCKVKEDKLLNKPIFCIEVIEEGFEENLVLTANSTRGLFSTKGNKKTYYNNCSQRFKRILYNIKSYRCLVASIRTSREKADRCRLSESLPCLSLLR